MVADLFNIYHTHQNESIEKASEMHTSTHPSHHLYHVWLACVRDMAFYVCLDLCSHHFLPLVSNTGAGNALLRTCVCARVCSVVWRFVLQLLLCVFCYFFLIFQPFFIDVHTPKSVRVPSPPFVSPHARHILHILWKIGFNMIYLRFANMYYDCNIQLT